MARLIGIALGPGVYCKGVHQMPQATRLVLFLMGMLAFEALGRIGELEAAKVPLEVTRHKWGQYRIFVKQRAGTVFERADPDNGIDEHVLIQDKRGRIVREIVASGLIAEVKFVELTGGGLPELLIDTYSGGAHCCFVSYYFTQDGGLRNLLIFVADDAGPPEPRYLNGDGRPKLVADSDVLAYFEGLSYASSPFVTMVLGWDGKAYRDQTKAYPQVARKSAQKYQAEFLKSLSEPGGWWEGYPSCRKGSALGYYANSLVSGGGAAARAWLLKHAPKETREWLFGHEKALRIQLNQSARKIGVRQKRIHNSFLYICL